MINLRTSTFSAGLLLLIAALACTHGTATLIPPSANTKPLETLDFQEAVSKRCQESERWGEPKPEYTWINQQVAHNDITVRLLQGKFTGSGTILEFLVEYPAEAGAPEYEPRFRITDRVVEGISSSGQLHFASTWGCGGRELHVLEGRVAVEDPQLGIRIELPSITRRSGPPPGSPGPATGWEKIEGPWMFNVSPATPIK